MPEGHKSFIRATVAFGDCDPAQMIYYPNYFRWFDQATWNLLETAGFPWETLHADYGVAGLPAVEVDAKFLLPVKWRDRLVFETSVRRIGRSSFQVGHTVRKDEGVCVEAHEVRVWARPHPEDPKRLKGFPIPPEVVERLRAPGESGEG